TARHCWHPPIWFQLRSSSTCPQQLLRVFDHQPLQEHVTASYVYQEPGKEMEIGAFRVFH
ncbi:hypothetical protein U0070_006001, partial [Myodes glareolus]